MIDLVVSYRCLRVFMAGVFVYDRYELGFLVIVQYYLPSFQEVVTRYVFFFFLFLGKNDLLICMMS